MISLPSKALMELGSTRILIYLRQINEARKLSNYFSDPLLWIIHLRMQCSTRSSVHVFMSCFP